MRCELYGLGEKGCKGPQGTVSTWDHGWLARRVGYCTVLSRHGNYPSHSRFRAEPDACNSGLFSAWARRVLIGPRYIICTDQDGIYGLSMGPAIDSWVSPRLHVQSATC